MTETFYQVSDIPSSCTVYGVHGSAAAFVKDKTVFWEIGSPRKYPLNGSTIAQAKGDSRFYILTNYKDDTELAVDIDLDDFFAFVHEDTSGWSRIAVFEKGKLIHDINWGYDYSSEMEEAGVDTQEGKDRWKFTLKVGDDEIQYSGPLDKKDAKGKTSDAVIDALCKKIGIKVVGGEYFIEYGKEKSQAKKYDYYGSIEL